MLERMTRPQRVARLAPLSKNAIPGTVLAFDFGAKRIGVAVGEAQLGTAHPLAPIVATQAAARFAAVSRLVEHWSPERLVVGVALRDDGMPSEAGRRAERFARQLEGRLRLPVARVDEAYSSVAAESRLREAAGARRAARASRARTLDSFAAQLILEQYFAESRP
jgi:putative holliday junction resolvase